MTAASAGRSIVVPEPQADLPFARGGKLILARLADEKVHSSAQQVPGVAAPLPAGLGDELAAVVHFLPQMRVERQERSARGSGRSGGAVVDAELKLPRVGPFVGIERPRRFAVEAERRIDEVRYAEHQRVAGKIDPVVGRVRKAQDLFVSQVRAEMVVAELCGPPPRA